MKNIFENNSNRIYQVSLMAEFFIKACSLYLPGNVSRGARFFDFLPVTSRVELVPVRITTFIRGVTQ